MNSFQKRLTIRSRRISRTPHVRGEPQGAPFMHGFSIIEALIAAAVLAIGILAVVSTVVSSALLETRADRLAQAGLVFEELVERMIPAQHDPAQYVGMTAPTGNVTRNGVPFEVNCTLTENRLLPECTDMTCQISWDSCGTRTGARHGYTFSPK